MDLKIECFSFLYKLSVVILSITLNSHMADLILLSNIYFFHSLQKPFLMGGTGNGENWVLLWWGRPKTSRAKNVHIFKLDLEKAEEPEIKLPISAGP